MIVAGTWEVTEARPPDTDGRGTHCRREFEPEGGAVAPAVPRSCAVASTAIAALALLLLLLAHGVASARFGRTRPT